MVGVPFESQTKLAEAEGYRRVLGIDSRAAVAANNLAWLLVSSGRDLNQALSFAQVASEMMPGEPNVADTLGRIYYRLNRSHDAIPHLESSVKKSPDRVEFNYHLGMACVETGDWDTRAQSPKARASVEARFRRRRRGEEKADDNRGVIR